jgi:hypothetical protein
MEGRDMHPRLSPDILLFLQKQLVSILKIVEPEYNRRILKVDGVRERVGRLPGPQNRERAARRPQDHGICLESGELCRFEPRLEFVRKQLLSILRLMELIADGVPIEPDTFILKNLEHWISDVQTNRYCGDPYYDILKYLSWPCDKNCSFCLHKGDPPGFFSKARMGWRTSKAEIAARLRYWHPSENRALFSKYDLNYFEVVSHPDFLCVAHGVRKKSKRLITIVTNGASLTREMVEALDHLRPLLVVVSLNPLTTSTQPPCVPHTISDPAVQSLFRLSRQKIPFIVSLPAVPELSTDDLERTIRFADEFSPYLVRLVLGAFTKYHEPRQWESWQVWDAWFRAVRAIRKLRATISTPIIVQPAMFEECFFQTDHDFPVVEGIVRNSPAFFAGIRSGDKIVSIGGAKAFSNRLVRYLFQSLALRDVEGIEIEIERMGTRDRVPLATDQSKSCSDYPDVPYSKDAPKFYPFGIVLRDSLDPLGVMEVRDLAIERRAEKILLLTSLLVKPSLMRQLHGLGIGKRDGLNIHVEVPQNTHFLGGEIILGDLLVVDDFVDCIRGWMERHGDRPDLVIIPSTPFSRWGFDLQGKSRTAIGRSAGVPVAFLNNQEILAMG